MKNTFACAIAALTCALAVSGQKAPTIELSGRRAPSFSLPDTSYNQHDILDYRGKWLLIEFLMTKQTDCVMCPEVTKKLDAALTRHGAGKLAILGIAKTPPETTDSIRGFVAMTKTAMPIVFDASMVGIAYFKASPTQPQMDVGHVFAINPQGTIVKDWSGVQASSPTFGAELDKVLSGASAPAKK